MSAGPPVRIALVGTRGFGRYHYDHLVPEVTAGRARLVGVVDVAAPEPDIDAAWFPSLEDLLARVPAAERPEAVIVATPIATHAAIAHRALAAGCDVLLEKPPVRSPAEHRELAAAARAAGRSVQVGFQAQGGGGMERLRRIVTDGELGAVHRVTARGAWVRDRAYYARSAWAGKRRMNGERVADGVVTNPLAHAVQGALTVAGLTDPDRIARIRLELRRAHPIEADDTSFVAVDPVPGLPSRGAEAAVPVVCALTLAAPADEQPVIEVVAEGGSARLSYTTDEVRVRTTEGEVTRETFARSSLVTNLLEHVRDRSVPLISPLECTSAFTAVLDATQSVPDPTPIAPEHVTWVGEGAAAHPVVTDIGAVLDGALAAGEPFSRIGAAWAAPDAVHEVQLR